MKAKIKAKSAPVSDKLKLFGDLMDNIPDVIYFKDKKGRLILVNKAHSKGLGLSPEQVAGKTDFDFFSRARARAMSKDDEYVLETGKPIIDKIERATRPDGIDNYVSTTKIPRFDEKGRVVGLIGITRDITKRMHLEGLRKEKNALEKRMEALQELNQMKSELISVVSHELRIPLAIVKEAVMLIFDGLAGEVNDKQKNILNKAKDNIERLKKIIEDLLDMSRIEQGTLKLHYSLVNLNELIESHADFFKKLAAEKGIALKYDLPKEEINIFIDAGRITQVLNNLINNAIKFTEEGGQIRVELKIMETKVRVAVIDTGVGISKDDLAKLFNKFVQVSSVPGADKKGLGLGLSIAKELVNRHGGEIWAESKLGLGSRFYFTLSRFYTVRALNEQLKNKINHLLAKGITVNLINMLVINYSELKGKTTLSSASFFKGMHTIINDSLSGFSPAIKKDAQVMMPTARNAEFSIIIPRAGKDDIAWFSGTLENKIRQYLSSCIKTKDVFIALGLLTYPGKDKLHSAHDAPEFLRVNEMYIGAEMRRYSRFKYNADIAVIHRNSVAARAVDISEGGMCFICSRQFTTDEKIKVGLPEDRGKKLIYLKGRVAWMQKISGSEYKVGVEFGALDAAGKNAVLKIIRNLS